MNEGEKKRERGEGGDWGKGGKEINFQLFKRTGFFIEF